MQKYFQVLLYICKNYLIESSLYVYNTVKLLYLEPEGTAYFTSSYQRFLLIRVLYNIIYSEGTKFLLLDIQYKPHIRVLDKEVPLY